MALKLCLQLQEELEVLVELGRAPSFRARYVHTHLCLLRPKALTLQMVRVMEPKTVLATAPASASQMAQTKASETETVMMA